MTTIKQGDFLIAEPQLGDANFDRSVVLICKHNDEYGTFGFVINRPTGHTVDELVEGFETKGLPIYQGGPVQLDTVHFIHQYHDLLPEAQKVSDGLYWGGDFEVLKEKLKTGEVDGKKIKFFVGYSGWDAGQLREEIDEKSWILSKGNAEIIFNTQEEAIWRNSILHSGPENTILIHYPSNDQLN